MFIVSGPKKYQPAGTEGSLVSDFTNTLANFEMAIDKLTTMGASARE